MKSLRGRLLLGTTITTLVVFALAGTAIYLLVRASLLADFDHTLRAKTASVAAITDIDEGRLKLENDAQQMPEFSRKINPEYFQVWLGSQTVRSKTLGSATLDPTSSTLPDGSPGRAMRLQFTIPAENEEQKPAAQQTATIVVARSTRDLDHQLSRLALLLVGVCGIATCITLSATRMIVNRSLAPASEIAEKISHVGLADLKERLAVEAAPRELAPIVERLNEMLMRLDAAFTREKAFTGNVAHELRTPLAGIRAALEVCATQPREPGEYRRVVADCLSTANLMSHMVESLLSITRLGAGQIKARRQAIRLDPLIHECWQRVEQTAKSFDVHWETDARAIVVGDEHLLRAVLTNLLDNAASYVDAGGAITIRTRTGDEHVQIEIENTGSTLSSSDLAKVFDPFWRADSSRTATGRHCGLGLTLARGYVELMGGTIVVESNAVGAFIAKISLPTRNDIPTDRSREAEPHFINATNPACSK
jgi:two-component system sensor histidine kinase QseC